MARASSRRCALVEPTQGQLPKIIAAYNAGPLPVARWSYMAPADPLLWIESIPYWETRYYVPSVFRNLWVYQGLAKAETPTLSALAQHRWPAFPSGPDEPRVRQPRSGPPANPERYLFLFCSRMRRRLPPCRSSSIKGRGATRNRNADALQPQGADGRGRMARQRRGARRRAPSAGPRSRSSIPRAS